MRGEFSAFSNIFHPFKHLWHKEFKNRPNKICGRQPLKNFTCSILEYFIPFLTRNKLLTIFTKKLQHMFHEVLNAPLKVSNKNTTYAEVHSELCQTSSFFAKTINGFMLLTILTIFVNNMKFFKSSCSMERLRITASEVNIEVPKLIFLQGLYTKVSFCF